MPSTVSIEHFLGSGVPIADVRSPGEHARGHIPGAHSLPLFTDAGRAQVGTLYKARGHAAAALEGLRLAGPGLARMAERARELAPEGVIGVHCWRGGERSASVAWLLERVGGMRVLVLQQGYKAFRQHVQASFPRPLRLKVLGGYTGTGKTELMGRLRALGEQVLDLEALALHKGSAFGGIGAGPQPTTEQYENLIWAALRSCDPNKPIWVEDESRSVGHVLIPDALYAQMHNAPLYFIQRSKEQRVERLVQEYGSLPKEELAAAIARIQKRLGPQHAKAAQEALAVGRLHRVAETALAYYDKSYARALAQPGRNVVHAMDADRTTLQELALELARQ